MNLGMILQDRWYPKQIRALQTQMTPFLQIEMQGDDPEKVRKDRAGMLAERATGTEDSVFDPICLLFECRSEKTIRTEDLFFTA